MVWNSRLLTPKEQVHVRSSVCKSEDCKYSYKDVPPSRWVIGDGIWECPECGYGIAPWDYKQILLDGHNRYEICERLNIPYKIKEMDFEDRDDAKIWIIANQLARRNLSTYDRAVLASKMSKIQKH